MREKEKQLVVSEVNILRELRHPFVVRYYDRIIDKARTKIFIVMEYCEGGDLGRVIRKCRKEGYVTVRWVRVGRYGGHQCDMGWCASCWTGATWTSS